MTIEKLTELLKLHYSDPDHMLAVHADGSWSIRDSLRLLARGDGPPSLVVHLESRDRRQITRRSEKDRRKA